MPSRGDQAVFVACIIGLIALCINAGYNYGYEQGVKDRPCATVAGEKVISSSAGVCYYVLSNYGRAVKARRAL